MSSVRTVRPRPLGVDERIPVFWSGREVPAEIKAIDGGALYRYLVAGTPKSGQKRQRGGKYHAPQEGVPSSPTSTQKPRKREPKEDSRIRVPRVRPVADYHRNVDALQPRPTFVSVPGGSLAAPYVRWHPPPPGMYDDSHQPEYDFDELDEAWLEKANAVAAAGEQSGGAAGRSRGGIMAAARGLYASVASRFRSSSGGSGSGAATPRHSDAGGSGSGGSLGVGEFERAIDKLELLHFDAVSKWWTDLNDGPSTSAPTQAPRIPATKQLLPKARAVEELSELAPDKKTAGQLYDHWHKRRQQHGGPLLERLWFEVPWKFVAFAHLLGDEEGDDEMLPFMASESRSAKRRAGARRRVNDEDAVEALHSLRSELEIVRTLADQVRRREKQKRLLLQLWAKEWRLRMELGRFPPGSPAPRCDSRELPHWGHGIGHPLGRGATSSRAPSRLPTPAADSDFEHESSQQQQQHKQQQVQHMLQRQRRGSGGASGGRDEPMLNRRGRPARAAAAAANAGIHASVLADTTDDFWPSSAARHQVQYAPPTATGGGRLAHATAGAGGSDAEAPTWGQRRPCGSPFGSPQRRRPVSGRRGQQAVTFARPWEDSSDGAAAEGKEPQQQRGGRGGRGGRGRGRGRGRAGRGSATGAVEQEPEEASASSSGESEQGEDGQQLQPPPKRRRAGAVAAVAVPVATRGRGGRRGGVRGRGRTHSEAHADQEEEQQRQPKQQGQQPKQQQRQRRAGSHQRRASPPSDEELEEELEAGSDAGGMDGGSGAALKVAMRRGVPTFTTVDGCVLFGSSARLAAAGSARRSAGQQAEQVPKTQGRRAAGGTKQQPQGQQQQAQRKGGRGGRGQRQQHEDKDELADDEGSDVDSDQGFHTGSAGEEQEAAPKPRQKKQRVAIRAVKLAAPTPAHQWAGTISARRQAAAQPPAPVGKRTSARGAAPVGAAAKSLPGGRSVEPRDSQSWSQGEPPRAPAAARQPGGGAARSARPAAPSAAARSALATRIRVQSGGATRGRGAAAARQRQRRAAAGAGAVVGPGGDAADARAPRSVGKRELRDLGINQDALEVAASWRHLFKPH